jgi:hypothetical protein
MLVIQNSEFRLEEGPPALSPKPEARSPKPDQENYRATWLVA